jgi:hypothetical protein
MNAASAIRQTGHRPAPVAPACSARSRSAHSVDDAIWQCYSWLSGPCRLVNPWFF